MRALWHSNAPWASTGYGQQTALIAPRVSELLTPDGEDPALAVSAFYGLEGGRIDWNGLTVLPNAGTNFGDEMIIPHALSWFDNDLRGGIVFTFMDSWILNGPKWGTMNVVSWAPIDQEPLTPMWASWFRGSQAIPLAISRFGERCLAEFDPIYVPHAVDISRFKIRDKAEAREEIGFPTDAFLIGVVAANKGNPSRKALPQILQAFADFRASHRDALLYLHTDVDGGGGGKGGPNAGVPLKPLVENLGLDDGSVLFCDQFRYTYNPWDTDYMAGVYSSFDVLLNPSLGEGFGLPIVEAAACGTPSIVTDYSSMPEVCGPGWLVEYERQWSEQLSWRAMPKIADILDALRQSYGLSEVGRMQIGEKARAHAKTYDVEVVMDSYWKPALKQIEQRFADREPIRRRAAA